MHKNQLQHNWDINDPSLRYRQTSNISRITFQNLNVSRLALWLPLPSPLKPGVQVDSEDAVGAAPTGSFLAVCVTDSLCNKQCGSLCNKQCEYQTNWNTSILRQMLQRYSLNRRNIGPIWHVVEKLNQKRFLTGKGKESCKGTCSVLVVLPPLFLLFMA